MEAREFYADAGNHRQAAFAYGWAKFRPPQTKPSASRKTIKRVGDSNGTIGDVFHHAAADLGARLAKQPNLHRRGFAERLHAALMRGRPTSAGCSSHRVLLAVQHPSIQPLTIPCASLNGGRYLRR
jgi:hypothetical protein